MLMPDARRDCRMHSLVGGECAPHLPDAQPCGRRRVGYLLVDGKRGQRDWPFGNDPRAIQGWLRSIDQSRSAKIVDHGHGQRLYPRSGGGYRHYDADAGVCSEPTHQKPGFGPCLDAWEDAFRFGMHKDAGYAPPLSAVVIGERDGRATVMARRRARPNAVRNGCRANTWKKKAAEIAPRRVPELASELIERQRREFARRVGHPPTDRYDLAIAAIIRMDRGWNYHEMATHIPDLRDNGCILASFHYNRLVEAMGEEWLTEILLRAFGLARGSFRLVGQLFVADGTVLSTAWTDNARRDALTSSEHGGPVQIIAHMIYEHRWGVPTAFRLTWFQRGVGSAEAPQLPYLVRETARVGFESGYVLADRAFSSENNFFVANQLGFTLLSPLKMTLGRKGRGVHWKPETKAKLGFEQASKIALQCNPDNPGADFKFLMPFRQGSEAWHAAQKNSMLWYVKSRPERSLIPPYKLSARKDDPESGYIGLPEDEAERERVILANQNVGRRVHNEYLCRMIAMTLRATVRAEAWYGYHVNYLAGRVFEPVAEDALMGPYRQAA
jgi:hypothetical protein